MMKKKIDVVASPARNDGSGGIPSGERAAVYYDRELVPLKYLVGFTRAPSVEGILFEMIEYLNRNGKDTFSKTDIGLYTKTRVSDSLDNDISEMERLGYIKPVTKRTYEIDNVPWKGEVRQ